MASTQNEPAMINLVTPKENKTISAIKRTASVAFQDSPFMIPPSPLMKRLGCGTYVTVYKYKRQKPSGVVASPWAIKKAKKGHARPPILDRLTEEAKILRNLRHPNIILFKKFTKTPAGDVCLSMEAFGKGLDDIIFRHQENEEIFTAKQTVQVAYSIASALEYLHNEKRLLHGDMKSGNILVKGDFEMVKLCDFGVSIFLKDDLSGPKNPKDSYVGSEPWYSKEVLNGGPITDKIDVFAYGLVLWEMLALDVPHVRHMHGDTTGDLDGSFLSTGDSFTIPEAYYEALGTRPPMPDYDYPSEYDPTIGTFVCCTIEDHTKRPNARKVVASLKGILKDFDIHPEALTSSISTVSLCQNSDKKPAVLTDKNCKPVGNQTEEKLAVEKQTVKVAIVKVKDDKITDSNCNKVNVAKRIRLDNTEHISETSVNTNSKSENQKKGPRRSKRLVGKNP